MDQCFRLRSSMASSPNSELLSLFRPVLKVPDPQEWCTQGPRGQVHEPDGLREEEQGTAPARLQRHLSPRYPTSDPDPGSGACLTPGSGMGKKSGSRIRIRDEH
jgi:hypothetical protein